MGHNWVISSADTSYPFAACSSEKQCGPNALFSTFTVLCPASAATKRNRSWIHQHLSKISLFGIFDSANPVLIESNLIRIPHVMSTTEREQVCGEERSFCLHSLKLHTKGIAQCSLPTGWTVNKGLAERRHETKQAYSRFLIHSVIIR